MAQANSTLLAFNRGILSTLGAARTDLARYAMAAEIQTNWMPRVLGSMMLRPGFEYQGASKSNAVAKTVPFVFSATDLAHLELTANVLRVWIDDVLITRPAVTAATTNGTFTSNVTSWTDSDEAGATSAWLTGGYLSLVGTGTNAAIREQTVAVTETGTEHALRVVVARGPVLFRVGSTSGGDEYVTEATLGTGTHSLAFTPSGNFYIRVSNARIPASLVDSITVEGAGILELPTPWGASDLDYLRSDQSGDILYLACTGIQQRKIERRSTRSWSVVLYAPENGPFRIDNTGPITLTPSAVNGDITLTASKALFKSTHVGALFRMASTGQLVTSSLTGADQFTDPIRVSGIDDQRKFQITITGTWVGTVTLQYSVSAPGSWVDAKTWTANTSETYDDTLDNQIIYYRIGIKAGEYTSGTAVATLSFASGSITGIVRITAYSSPTSVSGAVLTSLGGTTGTSDWAEGSWSPLRGWPSAVAFHEGRLGWFGKDKIFESASDGFENFDDTIEGDSAPIQRSLGAGPIDSIYWAVSLGRLALGTASVSANVDVARIDTESVLVARSNSLDEPLTPTNFNLKTAATTAVFVDRSGRRLLQIIYDPDKADYKVVDLTLLVPDLNDAGIVRIAVQRQPDTRAHCLRADGTAGVMVFDRAENVICWLEVQTEGDIEDVSVLPGVGEDQVYYMVKRIINSATVRYREKWAREDECTGFPSAHHADAHLRYSGAATTTITGLDHLEGSEAVVWGWNTAAPFTDQEGNAIGRDLGTFTVSGGQITGLSAAVTDACIGLGYTAPWKSMKQAFAAAMGTALNQRKSIGQIGLILKNTHGQGIQYGPDFESEHLQDIPQNDLPLDGADPDLNHIFSEYEMDMTSFDGDWNTDSRICLLAAAPRPCTVLACTVTLTTSG